MALEDQITALAVRISQEINTVRSEIAGVETLYNSDGGWDGESRIVRNINGATFDLEFLSGSISASSQIGKLAMQPGALSLSITNSSTGNALDQDLVISMSASGILIIDSNENPTGLRYFQDYSRSQQAGDRWIPDLGAVKSEIDASRAINTEYQTGTSFAEWIESGSVDRPSAHTGTNNTTVTGVTGYSQPDGDACIVASNYADAKAAVEAAGARLPTLKEVEAGAVAGTGCGYDNTAIWTQTEGETAGTHMVANGMGGGGLTAERSDNLTANVRMVYDNSELTITRSVLDETDSYNSAIISEIENSATNFPSLTETASIAAGSTLGLQQELLANAGQPGLTVLAVGYTTSGKVQGVSLGDGNVIEVYANGADFNTGTVLYREFMSLGEPIVFTGLSDGAIITSTKGFYGMSEQLDGSDCSPMPLLSYGLSFKFTFFFGFRNCQTYNPGAATRNQGWIHVVNGPLKNTIKLTNGSGVTIQGQENIELEPWAYRRLYTSGNIEYILEGTENMMACHNANMDTNPHGKFFDSRLIMPLTDRGITWPRSGRISAPYDNTQVDFFVRDGSEGRINSTAGTGVSPGSPVDFDAAIGVGTGANDADYEPNGATQVFAIGLVSAYSGADSQGLEASPLMPVSAMSQIVAQPFVVDDSGDGGDSGVAIASPYVGTAKVYEWNSATNQLDLAYTVPLNRNGVTVTTKEDQKHPAAGMVANESVNGAVTLVGDLNPGVVIADVPITVVSQSANQNNVSLRSQGGTTATAISTLDDETLMLGITPPELKAEIVEGTDGILYKRTVTGGSETWVVA